MELIRTMSFAIASTLYSLIPTVFSMFDALASFEFLSSDIITKTTRNIYLLVSAVMLFAFGIRLLTAIVNPESFNDKKKGFSRVFVHSIIGIILIGIIPFAFEKLGSLQNNIIDNNLIPKYILNIDNVDNDKMGERLRNYTFGAFFYEEEEVTKKELVEDVVTDATLTAAESSFATATTTFIAKLYGSGKDAVQFEKLNKRDANGRYVYHYNWLFAPILGGFVLYQLILLCMDAALRCIKLAFLQVMAPLVICGFIFSGTELLLKWLKETASTFISLFLKFIAVYFIILAYSNIDNVIADIMEKTTSDHLVVRGFIIFFLTIGLFQLIKLIPDLINSIFGTKIKTRGGIGGRLSEMAAVGGLAKNSWDKVKPAAAKLGAAGVVAASGPIGWGATIGAGALGYQWKKGFGKSKPLSETKIGRGIRNVGAGTKAVGTGLTTKGGISKSIEAGAKAYAGTEIGKDTIANWKLKEQNQLVSNLIKRTNRNSTKGEIIATEEDQFGNKSLKYQNGIEGREALDKTVEGDSSLTGTQKKYSKRLFRENAKLKTLNEIKDQKGKMLNVIDTTMSNLNPQDPNYNDSMQKLSRLKGYIENGKDENGKSISAERIHNYIRQLQATDHLLTEEDSGKIDTSLRKIVCAIDNSTLSRDLKAKLKTNDKLDLTNAVLLGSIEAQQTTINGVKADYEESKKNATEYARISMSWYEKASESINQQAMFEEQGQSTDEHKRLWPKTSSNGSNQGQGGSTGNPYDDAMNDFNNAQNSRQPQPSSQPQPPRLTPEEREQIINEIEAELPESSQPQPVNIKESERIALYIASLKERIKELEDKGAFKTRLDEEEIEYLKKELEQLQSDNNPQGQNQ